MTEHSINRSGSTDEESRGDNDTVDDEEGTDDEDTRSEAEIKRELRKSVVGRAILSYDRR